MKTHTTNYYNTFISVADDCPISIGSIPPLKQTSKSIANQQFDLINTYPYKYTSDEVLFKIFVERNELDQNEIDEGKIQFFSKGQACLRASPLTKRYGWGVHFDKEGKIAIYGQDSEEYQQFLNDDSLKVIKAMKSTKK